VNRRGIGEHQFIELTERVTYSPAIEVDRKRTFFGI
jgi:hypothetical protein